MTRTDEVALVRPAVEPAAAGPSAWQRRLLGAVALVPIASYLWIALSRLRYPYDLQWLEGGAVELVRRVSAGQGLYAPPSADFTPWPYPPLYFWLSAGVSHLTGPGYVPLRTVSLLSSLAVLVLIAAIVKRAGGTWLAGLVGAGLFAATFQLAGAWADIGRVDSLFLALLLGAVLAGQVARSWRGGVVVAVVLFLAFLTKQNAFIAAVPLLAWLVAFRRWVGFPAVAVFVTASFGSVVVGNLASDGWYGEYVIAELLGQPVATRWIPGFWILDLAMPLAIALTVVALWLYFLRHVHRPVDVHDLARTGYLPAVVAGLLAAAWAGRLHSGGYANVLMPAYAAVAILFGVAAGRALSDRPPVWRVRTGWLTVAFAAQIAVLLVIPWRGTLPWTLVPTAGDATAGDRLVQLIEAIPGTVVVPVHPDLLTQAGRPTNAQSLAVGDVLRGREGRARSELQDNLQHALDGVSVVILDTPGEAAAFEPALSRDFTLLGPDVLERLVYQEDPEVFRPVTDLPIRPTAVYVRTTDRAAVESVLEP